MVRLGNDPDPTKRIRQRQGQMIRKTRQLRGMSINELASAVGVTDGAVSQWETGRFAPRQQRQVAIAKTLDVPWSMIFGLDAEAAV